MKLINMFFLGFIAVLLSFSCSNNDENNRPQDVEESNLQSLYYNVIEIEGNIDSYKDINTTMFSDLGAWHAYAVPKGKNEYGGFTGPMLMDIDGRWLSNNFTKLNIIEDGEKLDFTNFKREVKYFPGKLEISLFSDDINVIQTLIFVDNRNSIIKTSIENNSAYKKNIKVTFEGEILESDNIDIEVSDDMLLSIKLDDKSKNFNQKFVPTPMEIKLDGSKDSYLAIFKNTSLSEGGKAVYYCKQKYDFVNSSFSEVDFEVELVKNNKRWNNYLNSYFSKNSKFLETENYKKLAVKSIITLISNWRSAAKDLLHDGTFPSISYQGFYGFWSWDSWKHAVAYSYFAPEIAKDNIRSMFDYQDQYGMVADCIYTDKIENNWRDTKPPLATWAVLEIFKNTSDTLFVKEMLPQLELYHSWWYKNRDNNNNGLCEYGSTDGTRIAAAWESGMDNAVRFDDAIMIKTNELAWSLNQESVDLNAYLYLDKLCLAELNGVLHNKIESEKHNIEASNLKKKIASYMFNNGKGYFYDVIYDRKKTKQIEIEGPEGWIPLWVNIATIKQAKDVKKVIMDEDKFNTKVPFPTLTADHEKFNPLEGYWRGPVWLDQAYFGVAALRNYGYRKEADYLTNKILKNAQGLLEEEPIYENYHPLTGKGLNAKSFSWSSAHILMMLRGEND